MGKIVKVNVYLSNMKYKKEIDESYQNSFKKDPPARIVMAVKGLDAGFDVEIDVIAEA